MRLSLAATRSFLRRSVAGSLPLVYRTLLRSKKRLYRSGLVISYRARSNNRRLEPSFFIAGTRKGGTTFLFRLLTAHPQVAEPLLKELNFFSRHLRQNIEMYRSFFPIAPAEKGGLKVITGESTPHYMYYPHAATAIARHFPEAKILITLREPAARAFSEWRMNSDRGSETLSFEEALAREEERLAGDWERCIADPTYWSVSLADYSYKRRGLYLEQIRRLHQQFPKENILVLKSTDVWKDTEKALQQVEAFLGLELWLPNTIVPENVGTNKAKPAAETLHDLKEYFRPYDRKLFEYLGWEGGW
jgi:sulfotransferase family protein